MKHLLMEVWSWTIYSMSSPSKACSISHNILKYSLGFNICLGRLVRHLMG